MSTTETQAKNTVDYLYAGLRGCCTGPFFSFISTRNMNRAGVPAGWTVSRIPNYVSTDVPQFDASRCTLNVKQVQATDNTKQITDCR